MPIDSRSVASPIVSSHRHGCDASSLDDILSTSSVPEIVHLPNPALLLGGMRNDYREGLHDLRTTGCFKSDNEIHAAGAPVEARNEHRPDGMVRNFFFGVAAAAAGTVAELFTTNPR
jgi:hypothetical protein